MEEARQHPALSHEPRAPERRPYLDTGAARGALAVRAKLRVMGVRELGCEESKVLKFTAVRNLKFVRRRFLYSFILSYL